MACHGHDAFPNGRYSMAAFLSHSLEQAPS
jgi:hypothetical protein